MPGSDGGWAVTVIEDCPPEGMLPLFGETSSHGPPRTSTVNAADPQKALKTGKDSGTPGTGFSRTTWAESSGAQVVGEGVVLGGGVWVGASVGVGVGGGGGGVAIAEVVGRGVLVVEVFGSGDGVELAAIVTLGLADGDGAPTERVGVGPEGDGVRVTVAFAAVPRAAPGAATEGEGTPGREEASVPSRENGLEGRARAASSTAAPAEALNSSQASRRGAIMSLSKTAVA